MATIPVYRTWVAGEIVTAAFMNTNIRDSGNFLLSWPVFEGRQALAQAVANGASVPILLDTEDIDTDNGHSTVTNTSRYVAQTTGRYQLSGGVAFQFVAGGRRSCWWAVTGAVVNGSQATLPAPGASDIEVAARTKTVFLTAPTDYVEIVAFQDSGVSANTYVTAQGQPNMAVRMVGTT